MCVFWTIFFQCSRFDGSYQVMWSLNLCEILIEYTFKEWLSPTSRWGILYSDKRESMKSLRDFNREHVWTYIVQKCGPIIFFPLQSGPPVVWARECTLCWFAGKPWLACYPDLVSLTRSALKPGFARGQLDCCLRMAVGQVLSSQH